MFVINANNEQQSDFASGAKYGFTDGYYAFFISDGRGPNPSCANTWVPGNCYIGDFAFSDYDAVIYNDYYFGGTIYGCGGRTSCGSYGENSARANPGRGNFSHNYVSHHQFSGGEIVGKEILSNHNMLYGFSSYSGPLQKYDYKLGLVHTDGTTDEIISKTWIKCDNECSCGKIIWNGNHFTTVVPEVHGGDGIVACGGDRIYIGYNYYIDNDSASGCLCIAITSVPGCCFCINTQCWSDIFLQGCGYSYMCSPTEYLRAKPILISVE